jgi:hypothetical protein
MNLSPIYIVGAFRGRSLWSSVMPELDKNCGCHANPCESSSAWIDNSKHIQQSD